MMEMVTEAANNLLYTPAWEAISGLAMLLGIIGIFVLVLGLADNPTVRALAWTGVGLLFLTFTFSVLFEELLPTLPGLPAARKLPFVLSFFGFALFLVMFVWSGRMVVMNMLGNMGTLFSRSREPEVAAARSEAFRELRPGLLLFGGSIIVFALSLIGYHGADVTLGWAFR